MGAEVTPSLAESIGESIGVKASVAGKFQSLYNAQLYAISAAGTANRRLIP